MSIFNLIKGLPGCLGYAGAGISAGSGNGFKAAPPAALSLIYTRIVAPLEGSAEFSTAAIFSGIMANFSVGIRNLQEAIQQKSYSQTVKSTLHLLTSGGAALLTLQTPSEKVQCVGEAATLGAVSLGLMKNGMQWLSTLPSRKEKRMQALAHGVSRLALGALGTIGSYLYAQSYFSEKSEKNASHGDL